MSVKLEVQQIQGYPRAGHMTPDEHAPAGTACLHDSELEARQTVRLIAVFLILL